MQVQPTYTRQNYYGKIQVWKLRQGVFRNIPGKRVIRPINDNYEVLVTQLKPLLLTRFSISLQTALFAESIGDYGSVCRNIGAMIEGSIASSLINVIRGDYGIRLPKYIDRYDPNSKQTLIDNVDINKSGEFIGGVEGKLRWKAPMLRQQLKIVPITAKERFDSIYLDSDGWKSLESIAFAVSHIRNLPAHGAITTEEQARQCWRYLEQWLRTGCASALYPIRNALIKWPQIPPNALKSLKQHLYIQTFYAFHFVHNYSLNIWMLMIYRVHYQILSKLITYERKSGSHYINMYKHNLPYIKY